MSRSRRRLLDLPFERVIISHGEPVHTRDAFERALELPQWPAGPLHLAAYRGDLERVRRLAAAGGRPDGTRRAARCDRIGLGPMEQAGRRGRLSQIGDAGGRTSLKIPPPGPPL